MNYSIRHTTSYTYHEPVGICHNIARLIPRNTAHQNCTKREISISPEPSMMNEFIDFFGNHVIYFSVDKEHSKLVVTVNTEVEKTRTLDPTPESVSHVSVEETIEEMQQPGLETATIRQFAFATPMTQWNDEIAAYAAESFPDGRTVLEGSFDLMNRIHLDFTFSSGITTIATPVSEVMKQRKGVCQDFAHLGISCLRSVGLAVRYISGYIETISPKGREKLVGADASHAWFSVYIPGMGWVDFDPTNNQIPGDQHITIGWGRDYADIAPFRGIILSSGTHDLAVAVDVERTT
ncbi:transglutaminase family protein [Pollutibacter soli]|uniref:transglutaminase family protein n=1 Tax=Pollutibacter soli TaxID=3034157 RepID=UPI003013B345